MAKLGRRQFVTGLAATGATFPAWAGALRTRQRPRRNIIVMLDGFGLDYMEQSAMPTLKRWGKDGVFRKVKGVMPSVTNTNNAGICCGVPASVHGITGNSYLDESSGHEEFMESPALLKAPTLFQRAEAVGIKSALLSSKKKTVKLLNRGASIAMTAEEPGAAEVKRYGAAPPIYSAEINDWLWKVAVDILATRPEIGCLYVHTTDYPMHMHPPEAEESKTHLARIDERLAEAAKTAPDAAFYVTADHGLNHKSRAWDLHKACRNRGLVLRAAISAEKDRYPKHHRGMGGVAWVYLQAADDQRKAIEIIRSLAGIEEVLTRADAAARFDLLPARIGDLVVTGDKTTVFGELAAETEQLPPEYRTHGSRYELDIPLVIHQGDERVKAESLRYNHEIVRHLYVNG
jgi:phosphonoacetate hydrolase